MDSPTTSPARNQQLGIACALTANVIWGLCPIYWRQIVGADSAELVCHRIVWSFLLLVLLIPASSRFSPRRVSWRSEFGDIVRQVSDRRMLASCLIAAVMIGTNWLAFIWAVNHERVLEASLGYYINPLFNVMLGVIVLGERLGRIQWIAIGVTAMGVGVIALGSDGVPWISLVMASSFAIYALVKKSVALPVLKGLLVEVAVLSLPAMFYLGLRCVEGTSALQNGPASSRILILAAGVITVAPLALFAAGVQRIKLALVGLLQFVGPTLQFFVGAFLYGEPLEQTRLIGFAFVWAGLAIFMVLPRLLQSRRVAAQN